MSLALYPHQEDGVQWLMQHDQTPPSVLGVISHGGLLCDDMGLGKTIQLIALMTICPKKRTLLVTPVSVCRQWEEQMCKAGLGPTYEMVAAKKVRLVTWNAERECVQAGAVTDLDALPETAVLVTTYGRIRPEKRYTAPWHERNAKPLENPECVPFYPLTWDRVILDEAHHIKGGGLTTLRAQRLAMNPGGSRWALTATPLQNHEHELVHLCQWVAGGQLAGVGWNRILKQWFPAKVLRRTIKTLPAEMRSVIDYPTEECNEQNVSVIYRSAEEAAFYKWATGAVMTQIEGLRGYTDRQQASQLMLQYTLQLRMLAVHPNLFIRCRNNKLRVGEEPMELWSGRVTKNEMVIETIEKYINERKNFAIFTHFNEELELFKHEIERRGVKVFTVRGGMSGAARYNAIQESRSYGEYATVMDVLANRLPEELCEYITGMVSPVQAFLIQIRAGGAGLNLQHIHNVIIPSPDWNPTVEDQAIGRCYRIGQKNRVNVHRFHLDDVAGANRQIERHIQQVQNRKRQLIHRFIDKTESDMPQTNAAGVRNIPLAPTLQQRLGDMHRRQQPLLHIVKASQ
jgi:SNF2 family DNA or RNA helicase